MLVRVCASFAEKGPDEDRAFGPVSRGVVKGKIVRVIQGPGRLFTTKMLPESEGFPAD